MIFASLPRWLSLPLLVNLTSGIYIMIHESSMDSYVTNYRILDLAKTFFLLPIYIRQIWTLEPPLGFIIGSRINGFNKIVLALGCFYSYITNCNIDFELLFLYSMLNLITLLGAWISVAGQLGFVEFRNRNYFRDLSWKVWHFWCCGSSESGEILRNPLYFTALFNDHFLMVRSWPFNLIITISKNHFCQVWFQLAKCMVLAKNMKI